MRKECYQTPIVGDAHEMPTNGGDCRLRNIPSAGRRRLRASRPRYPDSR
jgi:hypothetical protein